MHSSPPIGYYPSAGKVAIAEEAVALSELALDGGWTAAADAWINLIDEQELNRELLLDPIMLHLCGDVARRSVLDLGCGEGRFSRMLEERGAAVVGIDPVLRLASAARRRGRLNSQYAMARGESLPLGSGRFDLAVSYITLVDIADFRAAIAEVARVLKPGGSFLVANLGFVSASEGWARDEQGRRLHHRVDRYAEERPIILEWRGVRIVNWHRPLSAYMTQFLATGFSLKAFLEPVPQDEALMDDPQTEDWFRVPLFTVMLWQKTG
jgi:SAM-dependent methyltransferase